MLILNAIIITLCNTGLSYVITRLIFSVPMQGWYRWLSIMFMLLNLAGVFFAWNSDSIAEYAEAGLMCAILTYALLIRTPSWESMTLSFGLSLLVLPSASIFLLALLCFYLIRAHVLHHIICFVHKYFILCMILGMGTVFGVIIIAVQNLLSLPNPLIWCLQLWLCYVCGYFTLKQEKPYLNIDVAQEFGGKITS